MKVLALTDVHRSIAWLRKALEYASDNNLDTVTFSGDFQSVEAIRLLAEFNGRVFAVPGNMDSEEELQALEEAKLSLHGKLMEHEGYTFAGVGAFNFKWALEQLIQVLSQNKPSKLVLVSHYPPKGSKVDLAFNRMHVGSSSVKGFIETYRPLVCLCGHIHEARGLDWLGDTLLVNPGPLARGYAAIVDLNKREAELLSLELD
ncbi:MAG: hypothetical protein DRN06_02705 [Thermoprotei archaeon]|nr:MAG: hypothetical protein DRN06_02705 [Thermoprotei archaeon]